MEAVTVCSATQIQPTVTSVEEPSTSQEPVLRLRLQKPRNERRVVWREGTVDNEDMGRKKSKCCCIYKKPTEFGESSSEDDEECENCFGHPEKRKKNKQNQGEPDTEDHSDHGHEHGEDAAATSNDA